MPRYILYYMLRGVMRWVVRRRVDANEGHWWTFGIDTVVAQVVGTGYIIVTHDILRGVATGLIVFIGFKIYAAVMGYYDVRKFKRIQYQKRYETKLNPFLLGVIRNNHKRARGKVQD